MSRSFERLRLVVSAEGEDAIVAELWSAGTLGLEIRPCGPHESAADRKTMTIDAWFDAGTLSAAAVGSLRRQSRSTRQETIAEVDYLARYRAAAEPFPVARRFVIDPRDPEPTAATAERPSDDRFALRIPARVAFGTGSHETTRLMLGLLEGVDLDGRAVLDVGTGSGILGFAALRLGARRAVGFDLDAPSALVAGQNIALNAWPTDPSLFAGRLDAVDRSARFDVVLVNVLPERMRDDLPRIATCVAADGLVVAAGALAADRDRIVSWWRAVGFAPRSERTEGEWIGFVLAPERHARKAGA